MSERATREAAQLSVELEAKLLARLVQEWRGINYAYFKSALRIPVIRLSDGPELAHWSLGLRSLEISRVLVLEYDWGEVLETLKREVVVQFIDERLSVDERRHGPTYRRICARLGIGTRPTGKPRPDQGIDPRDPSSRAVSRIHKLLALAQSPNRHEAEAAAATARRLMFKFNMPAPSERPGSQPEQADRPRYGFRRLGRPVGPLWEHDRRLAKILNEYFFVESAWLPVYLPREGKRGSVLEVCGLEANLLIAEHVHAFARQTAQRLWAEYARSTAGAGPGDRLAFLAGVMKGFETKLAAQNQQLQVEGLVWVPAPDLGVYFRRRNPTLQYVQPGDARHNHAFEQGSKAGLAIVLSQPVGSGSGSGSGARPKALNAARSPADKR
ncbi:hypothetical protein DB30_03653 [Enhygromyxa salina]|uniref:Uncharacterized protein n=1 Tax=Enhygromyxa salina TaxID=215803 RepID=A0A0C2D1E7_9BACT|nr:DUF2786 domain-containing protein [Enhygromyxa salina]KIG17056.1 hypothetical protein DB30_03653 [Enhygromyxa salina]